MSKPEDAVIAAINHLERDGIDELVDWQLADSPAARVQRTAPPLPRWGDCRPLAYTVTIGDAPYRAYSTHDRGIAAAGFRDVGRIVGDGPTLRPVEADPAPRALAIIRRMVDVLRDLGVN